jgi:hypothetical protein
VTEKSTATDADLALAEVVDGALEATAATGLREEDPLQPPAPGPSAIPPLNLSV